MYHSNLNTQARGNCNIILFVMNMAKKHTDVGR
jgi:hypothetical protein